MFNNYIRGGQIFLHKMRMLSQVWDKTLFTSFVLALVVTGYLSYDKLSKLDYAAGITYVKAEFANTIHNTFSSNGKSPEISASSNKGVYSKSIKARDILNHEGFKRRYREIITSYLESLGLLLITIAGLFVSIMLMWSRFGKSAIERDVTKGGKVFTAEEAAKALKQLGKASNFVLGGMPLVRNKETSHILITGTTGSGKTNCMHTLLPQVRKKNQSAIIVDFTGAMVASYYDPARGDVILCPFDKRSRRWDFWKEVSSSGDSSSNMNLESLSKALFATDDFKADPFWNDAAEVIFQDIVSYLLDKRDYSLESLNSMIAKVDIKTLAKKLKNTYSTAYLDPNNEKTAASIRSTLATNTKALRCIEEDGDDPLCLWDWVSNIDGEGQGKWLFLLSPPDHRDIMKPLVTIWMDIIINKIMSLGENQQRRVWVVVDELAALKKLPSIPIAAAEGRKYGICLLAGVQSAYQLYQIYGQNTGLTMFDQFNTKFVFRTQENNFANYICKNFGEVEYKESSENYSYSASEMRDSVNVSMQEKRKPLVAISDLATLADCEAFVKLPEPSVSLVRIKMKYQAQKQISEYFVPKYSMS